MGKFTRREMLVQTAAGASLAVLGPTIDSLAVLLPHGAASQKAAFEWIRHVRLMIGEGYTPPFYPCLDYEPKRALELAQRFHCNAFRYPTYSYVAFFPTQTKFPHHPELGSRDPFRATADLFHAAGLKVVAYNPLNHPFMDVRTKNPLYADWMRYDVNGKPYITTHYGWTRLYEGCLNSPLREEIRARVREVVTNYPVDLMYFDGPYQGMDHRRQYCYCQHCRDAYQQARGKAIPLQNGTASRDDVWEYQQWLTNDVVHKFLQDIAEMVHQVRGVPVIYNNGFLVGSDVRSRAYYAADGFMFEASQTPEEKLFNLRVGQSTGKVVWTYISSHTEYNCEHLRDHTMRGWYSMLVEGERLQLDAAVATTGGAGYCYWGLNRLFYHDEAVLSGPMATGIEGALAFAEKHEALLSSVAPQPQVGILTSTATLQWYKGEMLVPAHYRNYYNGAFQVLKDLSYDVEPFLDYEMTPARLAKYRLTFVPNAACLSDSQCAMLTKYVEGGGTLVATHLTSVADEFGQIRSNYGLADILGATLSAPDPIEVPDLYLRILPSRELIPQDPQVMVFQAASGAEVLAETYDRGHRRTLGPAVVRMGHGKGQVIYIGSGLEAVYEETLNASLRAYFRSLLDPLLDPARAYEVDFRPGLSTQLASSPDALVLHLFANTGNICKKLLVQETFLPLHDVRVRLRIPRGKSAKTVALLWSGAAPPWKTANGWVELTVPTVHPYELVRVDLAA